MTLLLVVHLVSQDLSIAGKRAGLAGERSGLFMEQIRIVKEIRANGLRSGRADEHFRPGRFLIWENVYGAFSSNDGEDFRVVLEEICRIKDPDANVPRPTGKWAKAGLIVGDGYSVGWRLHDSQYHGVPQRRRRLCVLADLDGDAAGRILFELRRKTASGELVETFGYLGEDARPEVQSVSESLSRNSEPGRATGKGTSADAERCVGATGSITFQERAGKPGGGKGLLIQEERAGALACHPQGVCYNPWDVQSKHVQPEDGIAESLYAGECRGGGGESYVMQKTDATVYGISPYDSNAMKSDNPKAGFYEADTARTLDLNGASPICNQGGMAVVEVEMEVQVRKYPVDTDKLIECLQAHRTVPVTEIAERLDKPKTLVEHWFRRDKFFAIPDADVWFDLKKMLGIETDEFDESITTFETKPGNFDMRNRIHCGDVAPTITIGCGNDLYNVPAAFRKKGHPQNSEQPQEWERTDVNDTLNIFDNTDQRTPTAVVYDASRRHNYESFGDVCETVQAAYGTGGNNVPMVVNEDKKVFDARGNGDGETCPTLTGDHENRITDYSAICVDQGAGKTACVVTEDKSPTLACTHDGSPAVYTMQAIGEYADCGKASACKQRDYKEATDLVVTSYQEKTGSLMASGYSKLDTQEAANDMFVVPQSWDGSQVSPTLTANNANGGQRMPDKDNFNAVITFGVDCYNQSQTEEKSMAITSAATDTHHIPCANQTHGSVRRLTPLECTRLQGFPDFWVNIGDWVDENGKVHKDADSPKYKALGNSIALPWWQWLAYRIVAELKRSGVEEPKMASLFDGISGFPLVFYRAGCKPVWSSEIESFPIAVAKKHFGDDDEGTAGDVDQFINGRPTIKMIGGAMPK